MEETKVFTPKKDIVATVKELFGTDIPVATVPLPSRGVVYPQIEGNNLESVDIRSMTSQEENMLHSRAMIKSGKAISTIIQACVISKDININNLLLGDKNALMIATRVASYGKDYEASAICSECEKKSSYIFNLNNLQIKRFPEDMMPLEANTNLFSFILPISKKEIQFKLLTGKDQEEIDTTKERLLKSGKLVEDPITIRLKHQILNIAGITDRSKIGKTIDYMPAAESIALRDFIAMIEPDVEMKQFQECPKCHEQIEITIPFDITFFWPSGRID